MNEIRNLLRYAGRRLEATRFLTVLHGCAIVFMAILLVLAIADRVHVSFVGWMWVGPSLAVALLAAALALWVRRRPTELHVAIAVDERLDLRERMSTALHCHRREDAFARAALDDAVRAATDPRTRERAKRSFKVQPPHRWWIAPLIAVVAAGVLLLPEANLLARERVDPMKEADAARQQASEEVAAVVKAIEDKPQLEAELTDLLGSLSEDGLDPDALKTPEEIKRDAIKKVTELNKALDEILSGEKGQTAKSIENALRAMEPLEDGPVKELADAMAQGDFAGAKEALEKLVQQAQEGKLDEAQLQAAAKQMAAMAAQLEQIARQQEDLREALRQAGLDPELANNPQALAQQLQQNQDLNQEQKQQLQQMAQAQQQAQQMCQGLGQACQQMAQAMQGQMGQMGQQGMQQMGQQMAQQLSQMEELQQLMQQAQAAMNQCQGQCNKLGQGLNMNQAMQQWRQGGGMGGWGQGQGGKAPIAPTPTGTKFQQANIKTVEGEIIARTLFEGEVSLGQSTKSRGDVILETVKGFAEAQPDETIPAIYKEAHQHYFGELERRTEVIRRAEPSSDGGEPAGSRTTDAKSPDEKDTEKDD